MSELDATIAVLALPAALLAVLPVWVWFRSGRDPYFTDDDSVLMPEPPTGFSAALATVILEDRASRRTMLVGLMDLAGRNLLLFQEEIAPVGRRAGLRLAPHTARHERLAPPEADLYEAVADMIRRTDGYIDSLNMASLSGAFGRFGATLERVAATRGWLSARPNPLIRRWRMLGAVEFFGGLLVAGWVSGVAAMAPGVNGLEVLLIGLAYTVAGVVTLVVSGSMPARTRDGAMLAAMLRAYGRTLKAVMEQSASLNEVAARKPLPWVSTPEEHVAWAVAFHLDREVERIVSGSLDVSMAGGWPRGIAEMFSLF